MNFIYIALIMLAAGGSFASPHGNLQCEYSSGTLSYRDDFKIEPNGDTAYLAEVALLWNMEYKTACWSHDTKAMQAGNRLTLAGNVECAGEKKSFVVSQTLDLDTMLIEGTWKGAHPCRWL